MVAGVARILAGVACAALIWTAAAAAKPRKPPFGKVVTVTAVGNATAGAGSTSSAIAACPARLTAVGGGFSAPHNMSDAIAVDGSYRSSNTSWTAAGVALRGSGWVTAYAYCRRARVKPVVDVVTTDQVRPGAGETEFATARCPARTQLIGGGFYADRGEASDAFALATSNLATSRRRWTVTVVNNGYLGLSYSAHAYCVRRLRPPEIDAQRTSAALEDLGTHGATVPPCTAPRKVGKTPRLASAGGFSSPTNGPPGGPYAPFPAFSESRLTGDFWIAVAVNWGGEGSLPVTSQRICF